MPDQRTDLRGKSYDRPVKRLARRLLGLRPCACGCNFVDTRTGRVDFSKLSRIGKWATRDPDGD